MQIYIDSLQKKIKKSDQLHNRLISNYLAILRCVNFSERLWEKFNFKFCGMYELYILFEKINAMFESIGIHGFDTITHFRNGNPDFINLDKVQNIIKI